MRDDRAKERQPEAMSERSACPGGGEAPARGGAGAARRPLGRRSAGGDAAHGQGDGLGQGRQPALGFLPSGNLLLGVTPL
ncbi:MAG: hypothetical protein MUF74_09240 [Cypionkella sp.]|nr:hypothetical protein [Cypionkella sp.]